MTICYRAFLRLIQIETRHKLAYLLEIQRDFASIEEKIRENRLNLSETDINNIGLPKYWADILVLLVIYRKLLNKQIISCSLFQRLPNLYQYLLKNRWPRSFLDF
ncbi:MAG: hypothetical protein K940chlam7_01747 [Chlamydiae bacterium]|nr:hypothetical protein [Chlamydiota bacterium]